MTLAKRAILLFLFFYTMAAQPGLPACWLMAKPCAVHFHLAGMAEIPHSHGYLFDLVRATAGPILPSAVPPAGQLLALIGLVKLWKELTKHLVINHSWVLSALVPPPRIGSL